MTDRKNGRNTDGTFKKGNPGKPKGARHKATTAALSLLEGETEALTRKAVAMALNGDTTALRLCLERIAPPRREAPIKFDLHPVKDASDISEAASSIIAAVADGELSPTEGAHVMALLDSYRRTLETTNLAARVTILETEK